MEKTSTRENLEAKFNIALKPTHKQRIVDYAKAHEMDAAEIFRDGADLVMNCSLPVLGRIPCGPLAEVIQDVKHYQIAPPHMFPSAKDGDFLLEASGDSMTPRIQSGDFVMLRPNSEVSNGDVCAVQIYRNKDHEGDCEATLIRVFFEDNRQRVILRAYNIEFKDMVHDSAYVKIVAVMKGILAGQGRI